MEFEDRLRFIFANTNDLLKFAEAKNGALVVFTAGSLVGLCDKFKDIAVDNFFFPAIVLMVFLLLSLISALWSFMPRSQEVKLRWRLRKVPVDQNIIYAGHLADLTGEQLCRRLDIRNNRYSKDRFIKHLADQIVLNAGIAALKFEIFSIALFLSVAGILLSAGFFIAVFIHANT